VVQVFPVLLACCGYLTSIQNVQFRQHTSKKKFPNFIFLFWEAKQLTNS